MNQAKSKYEELTHVLAMINEMIEESVYHTETFAHTLQAHHNKKVSEIFLRASEQFKEELTVAMADSQNVALPSIPPWETFYPEYMHPSSLLSHAHYRMSEKEAWDIVEAMVKIHQDFYSFLCKVSTEKSVIDLANLLVKYCEKCGVDNK